MKKVLEKNEGIKVYFLSIFGLIFSAIGLGQILSSGVIGFLYYNNETILGTSLMGVSNSFNYLIIGFVFGIISFIKRKGYSANLMRLSNLSFWLSLFSIFLGIIITALFAIKVYGGVLA